MNGMKQTIRVQTIDKTLVNSLSGVRNQEVETEYSFHWYMSK